ncbi:unnamed protein product [Strongylus vulgaris]|uniref:Uncharacterized protein n=1 Tax=Strongylus vulgaris TaxID=40348 RepID=A0A3P7JH10_STRVU|nr:unnamed protein product [Strongylus vulgaris]
MLCKKLLIMRKFWKKRKLKLPRELLIPKIFHQSNKSSLAG